MCRRARFLLVVTKRRTGFGHKWGSVRGGESPWSSSLSSKKLSDLLPNASSCRFAMMTMMKETRPEQAVVQARWVRCLISWWMLSALDDWCGRLGHAERSATCSGVGWSDRMHRHEVELAPADHVHDVATRLLCTAIPVFPSTGALPGTKALVPAGVQPN